MNETIKAMKEERDQLRAELAALVVTKDKAHAAAVENKAEADQLRATLEEIERQASGALNNAFPEDAPDIVADIQAHAEKALKGLKAALAATEDAP